MESGSANDLAAFHHFVAGKLAENGASLSPEDALDLWRDEHPLEDPGALEALREALDDMQAGDEGQPLEEFEVTFRQRHGLPARP